MQSVRRRSVAVGHVRVVSRTARRAVFEPGNGSPKRHQRSESSCMLVLAVVGFRFSISLRLCRFSTDRNETFHTY